MMNKSESKSLNTKIVILSIGNFLYDARVKKEIETLLDCNYDVHLITNWQKGISNFKDTRLKLFAIKPPLKGILTSNFIVSLIKYLYYLIYAIFLIYKIKPKIVHCNDFPTLLVSLFIERDIKVVYDSHEIFSELDYIPKFLRRIIRLIEKYLLRRKVDLFITTDEFRINYFLDIYKVYEKKSIYLYNVPQYRDFSCNLKKKKKDKGTFSAIYFGSIQPGRYIEEIILAGKYLSNGFRIVVLGPSNKAHMDYLKKLVEINGIENKIIFEEPLPYELLLERVGIEDVSLVFYDNKSLNNYFCSPNKLFESIMVGLPIIASNNPILKKIVGENEIGIILDEIVPYKIAKAIMDISKKDLTIIRKRCLELAKIYNWEKESRKLIREYRKLM